MGDHVDESRRMSGTYTSKMVLLPNPPHKGQLDPPRNRSPSSFGFPAFQVVTVSPNLSIIALAHHQGPSDDVSCGSLTVFLIVFFLPTTDLRKFSFIRD